MMMMNGHIIPGTSICVDYWIWTPEKKYHHFLSHLHADHTVNLRSTFREKIYTSPFNAWLLRRWLDISPEYIIALDVGESHLIYDDQSESPFCVTLLDANHCPGSVMFLFQGKFGNILYTGDFRYNPKVLETPMLKSLIDNEAVDRLYLDNTFSAEHCEFPPRQEALKDVINVIKDHPDHNILLGVRKLGKEEVLRAIALEFKEKVCVSDDKLRILTKLGYERVFTTDFEESRIFVKEIPHITPRFIDHLRTTRGPVVTILLTALYAVTPPQAKCSVFSADTKKGIYKIPYSDHSCHSELMEFVSKIKPKELLPIVNCSEKNKSDSSSKGDLNDAILSSSWQNSVIPESILKLSRPSKSLYTVTSVSNNSFTSSFKETPVGCLTDDNSDTSGDNVIETRKIVQASKVQMYEKCEDHIVESKYGMRTDEPKEIIFERNCSPKISEAQSIKGKMCVSTKTINGNNTPALDNSLMDEEFFTMSDEDLSQLNIKSGQQYTKNKPDVLSREILENNDVIIKNQYTKSKGIEECQSNDNSLKIRADKKKFVNFTPCTPPSTNRCKLFKKRLPTPIPKAEQKTEEEECENQRQHVPCVDVPGYINVIKRCTNTVYEGVEDSESNDNLPLENQKFRKKDDEYIPFTPPLTHNGMFFKKRLSKNLPKSEQKTLEEENSESENSSEETVDRLVCNLLQLQDLNCLSANDNSPPAEGSICDFECDQNLTKSKNCQNFEFTKPVLKSKASMFIKGRKSPRGKYTNLKNEGCEFNIDVIDNHTATCITETAGSTDINGQYLPQELSSDNETKEGKEKDQGVQKDNLKNDLANLNPPAKLHNSVVSNSHLLVPSPSKKPLTEYISSSISKAASRANDWYSKDQSQNDSSNFKASTRLSLSPEHRIEEGTAVLKMNCQPPLPAIKPNDSKNNCKNVFLNNINSSVQKFLVEPIEKQFSSNEDEDSSTESEKQFYRDKYREKRKKILDFIFQPPKIKFCSPPNNKRHSVLVQDSSKRDSMKQCNNNEEKIDLLLQPIFQPQPSMSKPIGGQFSSTDNVLEDTVNIVQKSVNELNENGTINNDTSILNQVSHLKFHDTRDKVESGQFNDFVLTKYSDVNHSVQCENESDYTVSDLEDNCVTLEMLEVLGQRNDQINNSNQNNPSITIDVSQKFKHLLVNKFTNNLLGKNLLSPVPLKKQKTSKFVKSRQNATKSSVTEGGNCQQENNQWDYRSNFKKKYLDSNAITTLITPETQIKQLNMSIKESEYFYENFANIYKCWKEQVRELRKSGKKP